VVQGKKLFGAARDAIGLDVTLTAAMGKRTKFQQQDHAQLLLVAKSSITPKIVPAVVVPPPPSLEAEDGIAVVSIDATTATATADDVGVDDNVDNQAAGWDSGKYEVGRRVVREDAATGEEVAVRRILLDDTDGGARENILLEEGVKFTHLQQKEAGGAGIGTDLEEVSSLTSTILHPLDQAIILALCLDVSNSNPAVSHTTTTHTHTMHTIYT
jgi:hypothetical protein